MAREFVNYTVEDKVATIVIDRPPVNALDSKTMEELDEVLDELEKDPNVAAIVITGGGKYAFIAGADVKEMPKLTPELAEEMSAKGQAILTKMEKMGKPVIAAINGLALGGGLELAMATDIRIISDRARVGQPEINLGLFPGWGGTQRLPRIVGLAKAKEMIFTGDMISAQEAMRIGLVNKVVPDGEELKVARDIAKKIISKAPIAVAKSKNAMEEGIQVSLEEGLKKESKLFGEICGTEDMKEGVAAFIEKRQPKFKGK
ncbi:Short-chain-enoyl-CoA hydratase [subsurface metagenome]